MKIAFDKYQKKLALTWGVLVAVWAAASVWFFLSPPIKTSILDLIPQTETQPATRAAYDALASELESQAVILVEGPTKPKAIDAAKELAASLLKKTKAIREVTCAVDEAAHKRFFKVFFPARWHVLSKENRALLTQGNERALADKVIQRLYSVISGVPSSLLEKDPFYLFEDLALSMPRFSGAFSLEDGYLLAQERGKVFVLLTVQGNHRTFDGNAAAQFVRAIDDARQQITHNHSNCSVHWTGMAKYAQRAASDAQREVSVIGTGSLIGVVLLLVLAFSSLRELLFGLIPIVVGVLAALVTTVWIFGEIHMITLVFGASLVGVCIDYSFHFFAHNLSGQYQPREVLREVFPGITLGMVTSVIGYVALLIAPFPGLRQMAVFAGVGLMSAYATVVCWFPLMPFSQKQRKVPRLWQWARVGFERLEGRGMKAALVLLVGCAAAVPFIQPNDDIRLLRGEYPLLEQEERFITDKIGTFDKSRFLVVQAESEEALAQKEEFLQRILAQLVQQKSLGQFVAASILVPSQKVQSENQRFMEQFIQGEQGKRVFETMGWNHDDVARVLKDVKSSRMLRFSQMQNEPFAKLFAKLRLGQVGQEWVSVVLLQGVHSPRTLENAIDSINEVTYVDKVRTVTALFSQYRRVAAALVAAAYVVIFLFLVFRYGLNRGSRIIVPPVLTALLLLAGMSVLQLPVNIFTFLALLIVLAIGIDYTLFLAETKDAAPTGFAIVLSAGTTILSFGLLALSSNPGLRHFGATVLVGMVLAVLLAPLSRNRAHG